MIAASQSGDSFVGDLLQHALTDGEGLALSVTTGLVLGLIPLSAGNSDFLRTSLPFRARRVTSMPNPKSASTRSGCDVPGEPNSYATP